MNAKTARIIKSLSPTGTQRLADRVAMDPLLPSEADAELRRAGLLEPYDQTGALQLRARLAIQGSHEWMLPRG